MNVKNLICNFVSIQNNAMKDFKKYFKLKAAAQDVYNALTNPEMIEIWTGDSTIMSTEAGSQFELFGGAISGTNLEFEENKLIVQQWDFGDEETPSIVTMKIHDDGAKTSVELIHKNIPDEAYENITEGWIEDYFGALADLFNE